MYYSWRLISEIFNSISLKKIVINRIYRETQKFAEMSSETRFELASKIGWALNGSWDHNGLAKASKESLEGICNAILELKDNPDNKLISCSRCKCKYYNSKVSIKEHFGYTRLNEPYKTCRKCQQN